MLLWLALVGTPTSWRPAYPFVPAYLGTGQYYQRDIHWHLHPCSHGPRRASTRANTSAVVTHCQGSGANYSTDAACNGYDCPPSCTIAQLQKCGGTALSQGVHTLLSESARLQDGTDGGLSYPSLQAMSIREWGGLRASDLSRGDVVIAQVRNPWSYYASLWSYVSDHNDEYKRRYHKPSSWWPLAQDDICSKEVPRGNSSSDRARFAAFVRNAGSPHLGVLSLHVWTHYALPLGGNEAPTFTPLSMTVSHFLDHSRVNQAGLTAKWIAQDLRAKLAPRFKARLCWVHTENLQADAEKCMSACAKLRPSPKRMLATHGLAIPRSNPSTPVVSKNLLFSDPALVQYIQQADAPLFDAFPEYGRVPFKTPSSGPELVSCEVNIHILDISWP